MPNPIDRLELLPVAGSSCERPDLDGKRDVAPTGDRTEFAKDIAALANGSGGAILIGMPTHGIVFGHATGVSASRANEIARAYEEAARDLCRPTPLLSSAHIALSDPQKVVVAINVAPAASAPVGVSLRAQQNGSKHGWTFPIRAGSQTRYLEPDQFAMIENQTRRAVALLRMIPTDEWESVRVWASLRTLNSIGPYQSSDGSLIEIDEAKNRVRFTVMGGRGNQMPLTIPLDWVETTWRDEVAEKWDVALRCTLRDAGRLMAGIPPA